MNNAMHAAGKKADVAGNPAPTTSTAAAAPDLQAPSAGATGTATGQAAVALPAAPLPFGHWIALDDALPEGALPQDVAATPVADTGETEDGLDEHRVPDVLLAAMAPLVAPVAMPAMMLAMPGAHPGVTNDDVANASGARAAPPVADLLSAVALAAPPSGARTAVQAVGVPAATKRPGPGAAPAAASLAAPVTDAAVADASADTAPVITGVGVGAASAVPASTRGDSIVLAGPPTAWRQNLHEALGERLQLQLGRNIDQATIRLEPPMLGSIEIAIRHSGGNLEIHIAASNSEVLRQLNTVSDSLRSDLAGRQYSSVSVNVTEVPRMQAGGHTPGQGNTDAQGRARQEQEQARTPGRALDDGATAGSPLFSMN